MLVWWRSNCRIVGLAFRPSLTVTTWTTSPSCASVWRVWEILGFESYCEHSVNSVISMFDFGLPNEIQSAHHIAALLCVLSLGTLSCRFSYVGQDTQTLLILGSPQILTRKWCVGEMVTGRLQKVHTVLLAFPGFEKPDQRDLPQFHQWFHEWSALYHQEICKMQMLKMGAAFGIVELAKRR